MVVGRRKWKRTEAAPCNIGVAKLISDQVPKSRKISSDDKPTPVSLRQIKLLGLKGTVQVYKGMFDELNTIVCIVSNLCIFL